MHSALTGLRVLVTRTPEHANRLAHFCWGLLIVTSEKEMSYSDAHVHWFLFSGVSYCDNSERVFVFDYDTKEKEHQTKHSAI
jgi:hypothetical protein